MNTVGLFALAVLQSMLLAFGQVTLKIGLRKMETFGWNWEFWHSVFVNWQFAVCGLSFGMGSLLWMYIIKKYPLSMAYPMISLSYIFAMLAAIFIFHEEVELRKWIGVILIIAGCYLISK